MHQLLLVNEEPKRFHKKAHLIPVSEITEATLLFEPIWDSNGND